MRILIACEESGVVREAFTKLGHKAFSCDLLPSRIPGRHLQCDVRWVLDRGWGGRWDMMIVFPPCTHLCVSGARWFKNKKKEQKLSIEFFMRLANAPTLPKCGYWENQTPSGQNKLGPSEDRARIRATTYKGLAKAIAEQWGG
jgi:hypothetical protein